MARIRSIHPGLASDEAFMSMSMAAKAAWSILWTECDDHGVFEWKPIVLKARIFPANNVDFGEVLSEYEALDCVRKFEVDGKLFGCIRNFGKFQRPKKPSFRYPLPNELNLYVSNSSTGSPPVPNQSTTGTEKSPQMKEEGGELIERESYARAYEENLVSREATAPTGFDISEAINLSNSILKENGEDFEALEWCGFAYTVQCWLNQKIPKDFIIAKCAGLRGKNKNYLDKAVQNSWREQQSEPQTPRKTNGSTSGNIIPAQDRILEKLAEFGSPIGASRIRSEEGATNVRLLSKG